jgi:hypothetical protein
VVHLEGRFLWGGFGDVFIFWGGGG